MHSLAGFLVNVSLAGFFWVIYFKLGRRKLDLLSANFIACTAGLCLVSLLTDNLIPSGMPSTGWPQGPAAEQLALSTLRVHRFMYVFALLSTITQLHFLLEYCDRLPGLRRRIGWLYLAVLLVLPTIWTSLWLTTRGAPSASTSSWSFAIPWLPDVGPCVAPFTLTWYGLSCFGVYLLWRSRRKPPQSGDLRQSKLVLQAFVVQMLTCMGELALVLSGYEGISLIPIGSTLMGVLLAVALIRFRIESHMTMMRLERERMSLLESVPQPLFYVDTSHHVILANRVATNESDDDPNGDKDAYLLDKWVPVGSRQRAIMETALRTGQPGNCEATLTDGTEWMFYSSPVMWSDQRMLGAVVLAMDITRIRWAEKVLREMNVRTLAAREEERRRLARDLHDSLAQSLAAIHMSLHVVAERQILDAEGDDILKATATHCRELVQEVRHICYNLYPPALDALGLAAAIERALDGGATVTAECLFCCSPVVRNSSFGREIEISLFRVMQESVSNALRHGKADQIMVDLEYTDGALILSVTDDGCGFDPHDISRHGLGMSTMQHRIEGVEGEFTVESEPGMTRLRASVPCEHREPRLAIGEQDAPTS